MEPDLYDVAVMHDFFVDRLVHQGSFRSLFRLTDRKARVGGGSVHGIAQEDVRGGNAVNLAHALARLGNRVLLITHSDAQHSSLLAEAFDGLGADVRIKPMPPGLTLALEGRVNVMLSDRRGAASFPPSVLASADWEALARAKVVCSVNWAANRHGTQLLLALRKRLGPRKIIFLNPSDVRDRLREYRVLVNLLRKRRVVDWVSLNQFEADSTERALGKVRGDPQSECIDIAEELGVRVDVHTEREVYTAEGGVATSVKTRYVKPRRLTGAGDVWDAASITSFLRGEDDKRRLEFASAAARLYVRAHNPLPPTLEEVNKALR